jgi:hypothetical protein
VWTAKADDIVSKVIYANCRRGSKRNEVLHLLCQRAYMGAVKPAWVAGTCLFAIRRFSAGGVAEVVVETLGLR